MWTHYQNTELTMEQKCGGRCASSKGVEFSMSNYHCAKPREQWRGRGTRGNSCNSSTVFVVKNALN